MSYILDNCKGLVRRQEDSMFGFLSSPVEGKRRALIELATLDRSGLES